MTASKDNFSRQAALYKQFRPTYPAALYQYLLTLVPARGTAWDCGTGNGQVAVELARHFTHVIASDISQKQLQQAALKENIEYRLMPAEQTDFPVQTFDLITVGQAAHWFDFDRFYAEVNRVAKPNAILALWGYGLLSISPAINDVIHRFYTQTIGPYWDPERDYVDAAYATLPFPFKELAPFTGSITQTWTLPDLEGYLNTWSSVQAYIQKRGENPVTACITEIKTVWGEQEALSVLFPVFSRIGRVVRKELI
ncbi:SAM-dependent methyltransferase [Rufibacter radiotolerans]|uniref:SAM-dependent methyltransferase n=1 Tax=Rufibacter radiotolerans TaxID=1379910 RepID=A0A0H4VS42_9BACT|nr:class I SAM-dependent methyltransferase [Rufibacter radiotolerans]AKQ46584.1 SAM-dependent methyltransferase [Rufibacter radiotolerans]